jgi:hypothetical protein
LQSFSFDEVNVALTNDTKKKVDKLKVQHEDRVEKIDNFVRPWEELQFKRNKYGLGYEKYHDNFFHIPNYCKPLTFVSGGFLVNVDRKEELDKEHVHDVDTNFDDDTNVEDIDDNISIKDLLVDDAQLDREITLC